VSDDSVSVGFNMAGRSEERAKLQIKAQLTGQWA
jgi:hypothetical protein